MTVNPQPRPALRKAPDHSIHPAAPRLTPIITALPELVITDPDGKGKTKKGKRDSAKAGDQKPVELVVSLPKSLRKRVRAKAAEHGMTAEDAAYQLLRAWAGG